MLTNQMLFCDFSGLKHQWYVNQKPIKHTFFPFMIIGGCHCVSKGGGTPPPLMPNRSKTCLKSSPRPRSKAQSHSLSLCTQFSSQEAGLSHDAAGSVDRPGRTAAAAPGAPHVLRVHPASRLHATAPGGSTALPVWTRTLQCPPEDPSRRGQAHYWPPASRNVWGKRLKQILNETEQIFVSTEAAGASSRPSH